MEKLVSLLGLLVMIALAWLMSSHKRRFNLRILVGGLLLQFVFAVLILWTPPGRALFGGIGNFFTQTLGYVEAGSSFMFGVYARGDEQLPPPFVMLRSFAFGVLPTIIFFSSLMAMLYHLGMMQKVVALFAWVMQRTLGTSGAESLSAAANIFVGQTEAPLVIKPYVPTMTLSELNAVMVGGFATIAGGVLAAYVSMGIDAGHLVTASVISAPAALLIAKVMQPEVDQPQTRGHVEVTIEQPSANLLDAAAIGASDGMRLAINVAAMLIAFLALIAMLNAGIGWTGGQLEWLLGRAGVEVDFNWSLQAGLSYVFWPLAWLIGVETKDCFACAELLGIKMVANEFVAYNQLGQWMQADSSVQISARSKQLMTYALAGFSNFGSIGIQIGGIGGIAPERRADLARLGFRAMLGGTLACLMTACVAGLLI